MDFLDLCLESIACENFFKDRKAKKERVRRENQINNIINNAEKLCNTKNDKIISVNYFKQAIETEKKNNPELSKNDIDEILDEIYHSNNSPYFVKIDASESLILLKALLKLKDEIIDTTKINNCIPILDKMVKSANSELDKINKYCLSMGASYVVSQRTKNIEKFIKDAEETANELIKGDDK